MTEEQAFIIAKRILDIEESAIRIAYLTKEEHPYHAHSGEGWYCWDVDYPEDGTYYIG